MSRRKAVVAHDPIAAERINTRSLNDVDTLRTVLLGIGAERTGNHSRINRSVLSSKVRMAAEKHEAILTEFLKKQQQMDHHLDKSLHEALDINTASKGQPEILLTKRGITGITSNNVETAQTASGTLLQNMIKKHFDDDDATASSSINYPRFLSHASAESFNSLFSVHQDDEINRTDEPLESRNSRARRNWNAAVRTLLSVIRTAGNRGMLGSKRIGAQSLIDLVKMYSVTAQQQQMPAFRHSSNIHEKTVKIWRKQADMRSEHENKILIDVLSYYEFFQKYSPPLRHELAKVAILESFEAGKKLVKEGNEAVFRYVLVEGLAEIIQSKNNGKSSDSKELKKIGELQVGQGLETWVDENRKRTATVICLTDVIVLRIDIDDFEGAVERARASENRSKYNFLRGVEFLREMSDTEIKKISENCYVRQITANTCIFREAEFNSEIFFLQEGEARAVKVIETPTSNTHVTVGRLLTIRKFASGEFFGEHGTFSVTKRQILNGLPTNEIWKNPYTCVSNTKCTCIVVSKVAMINIASDEVFERMNKDSNARNVSNQEILDDFAANLKWDQFRKDVIQQVQNEQHARAFIADKTAAEHNLRLFNSLIE